MKRLVIALSCTLTCLLTSLTAQAQQPVPGSDTTLKPVMRLKLDHSKNLLEGLALEDYDKIRKSAQQLGLLSLESGWKILQTEEYAKQSLEFRRAADVIAEAAREKKLERAALGYVALTVRCIECHGYLRRKHPELSATSPPAPKTSENSTAAK